MKPYDDGGETTLSPLGPTRIVSWLVRLCGALSTALIVVILAVISYAIVQRYVLGTPLLWADELNGYLLVAMVMLGAAEALRRGDHIAIDLIASRMTRGGAALLSVWGNLAVIAFSAVLGWSAWESIAFAYDFGSYSPGHMEIAMWIPMIPILAGSGLLVLTALVRILEAVSGKGLK